MGRTAAMLARPAGRSQVSGGPRRDVAELCRLDAAYRLNAVCPYYTMFPLQFPWDVLREASPGDWVLDPFCGRGTTLFAARLRGLGAVGMDVNPVAVALATAKLKSTTPEAVAGLCERLLGAVGHPREIPAGEFWELAYHETTLQQVCLLRERLKEAACDAASSLLRAVVLGVLHGPRRKGLPSYLSNQMPRTYASKPDYAVRFWRERAMKPLEVDVLDVVARRARYTLAALPPPVPGYVRLGDAVAEVSHLGRRFRWVITSPPYYGMRTYLPDQWLRSWFLGGPAAVTYGVPGQLQHTGVDAFVGGLAEVWRATARRCEDGARLVVRFGALPSLKVDPGELIRRSLDESGAGWHLDGLTPAGSAPTWSRQAAQFSDPGRYVEEVDCYATLRR
jgi:hypothetical protein